MKITLARGEQAMRALPELSGIGYRESGFRVAPLEDQLYAKAAIASRKTSPAHREWVKDLAGRLLQRRGEFHQWKRTVPGTMLERLWKFADEMSR